MNPEVISHYRILKKLGSGGMGEVYLAQDTQLERRVAIKFLPPEFVSDERARRRLVREARAVAKLDHPNICSIYEVIEQDDGCCIVMQFIEGETLASRIARAPLKLSEIIEFSRQVADALGEAHSHGIVHRDIKPHNIMITLRGQAKVLDFGLAKSVGTDVHSDEIETRKSVTEEGVAAGTVPYMSPEQVRGEVVDARTDIFSLGVVMYEMVTGRQPFEGGSNADVIAAILTQEPPVLSAHPLEWIVGKALRKDKDARYRTATDLLVDLKTIKLKDIPKPPKLSRVAITLPALIIVVAAFALLAYLLWGNRRPPIDSLAVLPFVNMSSDTNAEYLSDGISDSIITSLSELSNLKVISLGSVLRYKGQQVDPQAVGRDLNVRAVLLGRLTQVGDALSISAELVDLRDNRRIWGQQFNRKVSDILQLQLELSREISAALRLKLSDEDQKQLAKSHTTDPEAYRLFLQGRFYWNLYTETGFRKSIESYERAVQKDPNFALAYAGLADSYVQLAIDFLQPDGVDQARSHALKAIQLDDTLAEAHMSLGEVKLFYDWDWPAAETEFKRAIQLNSNYPDTYHFYGHYLEAVGKFDDAIRITQHGLELDPNSVIINAELGWAYFLGHQYDQCIEQLTKTLKLDPRFGLARQYLGMLYLSQKRYDEAIEEFKKALEQYDYSDVHMDLAIAYRYSGNKAEAERILRGLEDKVLKEGTDPYVLAPIYTSFGDKDQAIAWLNKAYDKHSFWIAFIKVEPLLDPLRSDPRFKELVRRVNFPQ